jgi:hypothetical protein
MPNFDPFSGSIGNVASTVGSIASQAVGVVGTVAGTAGRISGAINNLSSAAASISALRSINLPPGGNPVARLAAGAALFSGAIGQATGAVGRIAGAFGALSGGGGGGGGGGGDWRATISGLGEKLIFPYTPTIGISGGANYEEVPITHQNYSFFAYQNSKAESISISAPWYNEDATQGQIWVEAVNFLRRHVKMFPDGNPPFICKFDAYGDHVFSSIPVVIRSYTVDLPNGVDYISTGSDHVPIKSNFSVTLQPIYSREQVKGFSLSDIGNGTWV